MRADRSLIPGLGAAASLVAAIACAFFVTAALVAFNGWPQVVTSSSARALIVASDSRHVRAIVVPTTAPRVRTARPSAGPPARPRTAALVAQVVTAPQPRRILSVAAPVPSTQTAVDTTRLPKPPAVKPVNPTPPPNTLAATTQNTTTTVSGVLNGVTSGLANTVAPVSPVIAGTVQNLGTTVSGAVITLGDTLAQLLLGLSPSG